LTDVRLTHPTLPPATADLEDGVVLVSCTDGELDTGGRLHALNATNGRPLWVFDADDNGTSYGIHYVPAVDNTRCEEVVLLGWV
jgi:outer membrane protein assembly factor BamB